MNKKLLADKIFNLKRKIHESSYESSWKDTSLGKLQDILSAGSYVASFIPGVKKFAPGVAAAAAAVNMSRIELDKAGIVPSRSGNLETQGQILTGRALGLITKRHRGEYQGHERRIISVPFTGINRRQSAHPRRALGYEGAQTFALFGGMGANTNKALMMGSLAIGHSRHRADDLLAIIGSSEFGRKHADSISHSLGIPLIPGLSNKLTEKEPLATERSQVISRSPTSLDLVTLANQRRQGG